ncbi:IS30 family transposase [Saccharopolyspora cebuensis]|uniref:IS30 family transposase n=1 Tax=Saccharopolyspora cebuensis TaxID=418759 RepID=A0ABV4CRD4_9PSEU
MGRPGLSRSVRVVFWEAVRRGGSLEVASAAAGVSTPTGTKWFRNAGGVLSNGESQTRGRFLSWQEREEIALLRAEGLTPAGIARSLGRARSTIGRELARNTTGRDGRYRASTAQAAAERRARRPKAAKLAADAELRAWVRHGLEDWWSPEQISARLAEEFPDRPEMRVSHETIYQSLYVQGRGALRRELTACLRTGRALRKPHRMPDGRRQGRGRIPDMVTLSERPAEAADRAVPGHWEGDLIVGADGASAIGTLVERSTRYCLLVHLPTGKDAISVRDQMIPTITSLPEHLRRSLTWDQGTEMARHTEITLATDLDIYFCDPHSPWQRGTNENTNGLLRQYFPKGTDLSVHTPEHLAAVAVQLNGRPRKTLQWRTPAEALDQLLSTPGHVATTN